MAYTTFVLEAGGNDKETQILARHTDVRQTMKTYALARSGRLSELAEAVGETIRPAAESQVLRTGTDNGIVATSETAGTTEAQPGMVKVASASEIGGCGSVAAGSIPAASTIFKSFEVKDSQAG
ncbi:MAG: hypothetical protein NTW87_00470 [Planctomycetota bacterium]|nr:hypothetical protein [Planctomycetota bacterium]